MEIVAKIAIFFLDFHIRHLIASFFTFSTAKDHLLPYQSMPFTLQKDV